MSTLHLRAGRRDEARLLSDLVLRSKGHWGYDQTFLDACRTAGRRGFERITLEADPGAAEPFYLAMGANRIGSVPSGSIPGRFIPLLEVPIVGAEAC
jgi:hypothetical protein